MLYDLSEEQLRHTLFPLGEFTKPEVRAIAEENGFVTSHKSESQDICFVPDGDYAGMIHRYRGKDYPKGDFVDKDGNVLGTHDGIINYTIGQRRGLGIPGVEFYSKGQNLRKIANHKIVSLGMAQVPEGRRVFAEMTVLQNLKMGAYTRRDKAEIEETLQMIYKRFPRLEERKSQLAGTLSGGEQQMLAMGRALMSHPDIILMDEPSMGLSPIFVNEIFKIIQDVNKDGVTVLLVEQNAKKALSIANRAYVLETGSIVKEGPASELLNDESIKKAYLGE